MFVHSPNKKVLFVQCRRFFHKGFVTMGPTSKIVGLFVCSRKHVFSVKHCDVIRSPVSLIHIVSHIYRPTNSNVLIILCQLAIAFAAK